LAQGPRNATEQTMKRILAVGVTTAMLAVPLLAQAKVQGSGGPIADATLIQRRIERDYRAAARTQAQARAAMQEPATAAGVPTTTGRPAAG
jgi:hypothetical protein